MKKKKIENKFHYMNSGMDMTEGAKEYFIGMTLVVILAFLLRAILS